MLWGRVRRTPRVLFWLAAPLIAACAVVDDSAAGARPVARADTGGNGRVPVEDQHGTPVARRVLDRPPMQQLPIIWDDDRLALTAEHLDHHLGLPVTDDLDASTRMEPKVIVLHWTAGPTAKSAYWTFYRPRRERRDPHQQLNLSVHFIVDRDGTIYQLMPTDRVAAHVVGLNHVAIGVENVGDGQRWPLTPAQVSANIALVRYLADKHDISHLIGHYEFKRFHGHPFWLGPDGHNIGRADPGEDFMAKVRGAVADLGLAGAPPKPSRRAARGVVQAAASPAALVRTR
ncbi:MAG: peptidoglycan recognition family protein [Myxococcota bacterium]|nr:peptidoglycan recognition family protein [Myxococcota bacterium]